MQLIIIIMNLQIVRRLGTLPAFLPQMKEPLQGLTGSPAKPFFYLQSSIKPDLHHHA